MKSKAPSGGHSFAQEFKAAREAAGFTQDKAAEVLQMTARGVQQWESGGREPIYAARFGALMLLKGYTASKKT